MSNPRKARETTLRLLFQWEMTKDAPDRVKEIYWKHAKSDAPVREAADPLFDAVIERVEEIDRLLQKHTENWRVERLSAVDRNILRLAVGEFFSRPSLSPKIVISEALEVARRYSSDESAHFINGVLDAIRRDLNLPVEDSASEPS
jgi:transcription antitermination protein NusB